MNNSISFTGQLRLRDFSKKLERTFNTTEAQDKLIAEAAEKMAPLNTLRVMTKEQVQEFHKLIEQITGIEITNIKNEKGFYRSTNNVTYADRFIRPWAGIHIDINI